MLKEINLIPTCSFQQLIIEGQEVTLRSWETLTDRKAIALMVHGLGAHSAWFEAMGQQLTLRGFQALAYDQCGFGTRSSCYVNSFEQWINDLQIATKHIHDKNKNIPIYLMGNSMGALVTLASLKENLPISGVVIFSPGLQGHPETFTLFYKLQALGSAVFCRDHQIKLPFAFNQVTRVESVRQFLDADTNKRQTVSGKMLLELLRLAQEVNNSIKALKYPLLMCTAGIEKIVDNNKNKQFFATLDTPLKLHQHFKDAWHDLMLDPVLDEVADAILAWHNQIFADLSLQKKF